MGLFTNKDKACPICGNGTPRLFATKIEGAPICSNCNDKILADNGIIDNWTLENLKKHLAYRSENKKLVENFTPTRTVTHEREMVIDDVNQLFYFKSWVEDNPPVFKFGDITGFNIKLGCDTVETWCKGMERTPYQPMSNGFLAGISALASLAGVDKSDKDESVYENLNVLLQIDTPYLHEYELCSISLSGQNQTAYMDDVARQMSKVNSLCNLLIALSKESDENVGTSSGNVSVQTGTASDTNQVVADLKKFKELMETGVISAEEFEAKKKQLLGI